MFLVFAFWESNHCQYIYDTNSIVSAKKSESKIASEKIENTFGASNQLVVMVPKGDYDSEKKVLGKIEKLDYVNSALGLANVAINDDYMLTDKLNPRQFAELTDLDVEVVQILYTAYAYNEEQYGPVFTGIDDYEVPIIDMFLFLYDQYQEGYVTLDADLDDQLTSLYDTLHDAQLQLQGDDYSRFVLDLSLPAEGQETYDAMDEIRGIAAKYFGKDNVILVGNSTSDHDLESSFASDNIVISVLTALFVMIICFSRSSQQASGASGTHYTGKYLDQLCSSGNERTDNILYCVPDRVCNSDGCNDRLCNRYFQQIHGSETENADQRCDY